MVFRIIPQYKLILVYDVRPEKFAAYQQYILNEFIPALQEMELYIVSVWHTAYGDYPMRQLDFVMEELTTLREAVTTPQWRALETKLQSYTLRYQRVTVPFQDRFQFPASES